MSKRRTSDSRSRLGPEIHGMLLDFCEAHHGANPVEVTKRAVRELIFRDVQQNEGVRKEYERLQKVRMTKPTLKVVSINDPDTD